MAHGFYLGIPMYVDEKGKLTMVQTPVKNPGRPRKIAGNSFYVDDLGRVWLGWFTRRRTPQNHVEMCNPPRLAPDNWPDFLKNKDDTDAGYPVVRMNT